VVGSYKYGRLKQGLIGTDSLRAVIINGGKVEQVLEGQFPLAGPYYTCVIWFRPKIDADGVWFICR
jgi:hypothetical protein